MDASLWVAKTGLNAQQTRMTVIANNLANVNTVGFKRDRPFLKIFSIRIYGKLEDKQVLIQMPQRVSCSVRVRVLWRLRRFNRKVI